MRSVVLLTIIMFSLAGYCQENMQDYENFILSSSNTESSKLYISYFQNRIPKKIIFGADSEEPVVFENKIEYEENVYTINKPNINIKQKFYTLSATQWLQPYWSLLGYFGNGSRVKNGKEYGDYYEYVYESKSVKDGEETYSDTLVNGTYRIYNFTNDVKGNRFVLDEGKRKQYSIIKNEIDEMMSERERMNYGYTWNDGNIYKIDKDLGGYIHFSEEIIYEDLEGKKIPNIYSLPIYQFLDFDELPLFYGGLLGKPCKNLPIYVISSEVSPRNDYATISITRYYWDLDSWPELISLSESSFNIYDERYYDELLDFFREEESFNCNCCKGKYKYSDFFTSRMEIDKQKCLNFIKNSDHKWEDYRGGKTVFWYGKK